MNKFFIIMALSISLFSAENKKTKQEDKKQEFRCEGKKYCKEMKSCAEAKFYLNQCGVTRLDRDKDGILDNGHHVVSWSATSGSIASDGYFIAPNVKGSITISATYQYINLDGTYGYIEDKKEIQILDDSWEW